MDVKELRIGNWVKLKSDSSFKEHFSIIECLDVSKERCICLQGNLVANRLDQIEGVLLTNNILDNSKYLVACVINGRDCYFNGDNVIVLPEKTSGYVFVLHSEASGATWILKNFRYVHELQNLYWIATGDELHIDLK